MSIFNGANNMAFICGFEKDVSTALARMDKDVKHEEGEPLMGLLIDTGSNTESTMGIQQYKAYCNEYNVSTDLQGIHIDSHIRGVGSSTRKPARTVLPTPFPDLGLILDISFTIIDSISPHYYA